jgi:hypothetical protein
LRALQLGAAFHVRACLRVRAGALQAELVELPAVSQTLRVRFDVLPAEVTAERATAKAAETMGARRDGENNSSSRHNSGYDNQFPYTRHDLLSLSDTDNLA